MEPTSQEPTSQEPTSQEPTSQEPTSQAPTSKESTANADSAGSLSPGGCLLRLFWMGFGNALLLFSAFHIARAETPVRANVIFAAFFVSLVAARSVDVLRLGGTTTDGRPATAADLRRYLMGLVLVSASLWVAANAARGSFGSS